MDVASMRLDGKVALITGAGRGIGLGIAQALVQAGAAVAIQDIEPDIAESAAGHIRESGGVAAAFGGDISDITLPARLVPQVVERLGGIHILVNNAAIQSKIDWLTMPYSELEEKYRANVGVPLLFIQQVVPIFRSQRFGRIINIGSIQGREGNTHMMPYAMTKAAIRNMTQGLGRSLAAEGITANVISPGYYDTHRNRGNCKSDEEKEQTARRLPAGRLGLPRDIGGLAVLLCSQAGEYITAQTIHVDGGMSAN
jgi:NAD(P)-dependent dehydrogenase (short-subunit alcohol dehydrogenase family)